MQNFIDPCDCLEGFCPHYNITAIGSKYKLLHDKSKKGIAFRKAHLIKDDSNLDTEKISIPQKIENFITTFIKHLKNNKKEVTKTTYVNRLSVCLICPHNKKMKCEKCGCSLETKAKWAVAECPLGKWARIPLEMQEGDIIKSPCGCSS